MQAGNLFIVSAPSGAGKTSLLNSINEQQQSIKLATSFTTRSPREGEVDGEEYTFIDKEAFQNKLASGDLLESACIYGNFYGSSKSAIELQLNQGHDVILNIDWQGAQQVRKVYPDCQSIFILPPSRETLLARLRDRNQDSEAVIQKRIQAAKEEISHFKEFDYLVINDDFQQATQEIISILTTAKLHISNAQAHYNPLISDLLLA